MGARPGKIQQALGTSTDMVAELEGKVIGGVDAFERRVPIKGDCSGNKW